MAGAQDVKAMMARVELLDELYKRDGRDDPKHERHGHYTGLFVKYANNELNA